MNLHDNKDIFEAAIQLASAPKEEWSRNKADLSGERLLDLPFSETTGRM